MPPTYQQANRPITVTTPLGPDVLLLVGFSGHEGISQLFSFELDLAAPDQTKVVFDKLLGHKVTVNLTVPGGQKRYFSGICTSLNQGMRGIDHTSFQMQVAPHLWLLTLRSRSRIFQNESVPEILKKVLDIPDVVYELEGTFHPRTYCVQYRETDFHFASRLMEDEGIYYYFKHKADSHQLVVSNKAAFPELQPGELILQQVEGTQVQEERISRWQKRQQLASVKVTLRDYHFQMPQKSLEASEEIQNDVKVGKVTHKLRIGEADHLEVYDWPGEYAHRFDAIDRGGAERPEELQKLLKDNERTAKIRMEQEAAEAITVQGVSRYRHLVTGHTFTLREQVMVPYDGSSSHDGKYVLTSVSHTGRMSGSYRSGEPQEFLYENSFTCIPAALHYRPQRITPKPIVMAPQTAVVVGPKGEQIFTDKYGRVKVHFHWDREGKHDAGSSCWIRVSQFWTGNEFGAIYIPRVGQEVVIAFEEGDPDRPIIVGSVYNADNRPPFKLPENRFKTGVKTSSINSHSASFSGIAVQDEKDGEHVHLHGEKNLTISTEENQIHYVGGRNVEHVRGQRVHVVGGLPGASSGGGSGSGGSVGWDGNQFQWKFVDIPMSNQYVVGFNSEEDLGCKTEVVVGPKIELLVDPVGYLGEAAPSSPWGLLPDLFGGHTEVNLGTNMLVVIGPKVEIVHGAQIEYHSPNQLSVPEGFLAAGLAAVAGAGIAVAGITPSATDPSSKDVGYGALIGGAGLLASLIVFLRDMHLKLAKDGADDTADATKKIPEDPKSAALAAKLTEMQTVLVQLQKSGASVEKALAPLGKIHITEGDSVHMAKTFVVSCTDEATLSSPPNYVTIVSDQLLLQHKAKIVLTTDTTTLNKTLPTITLDPTSITLAVGASSIVLNATSVTLKAGTASITMNADQIAINGALGKVNVSGQTVNLNSP